LVKFGIPALAHNNQQKSGLKAICRNMPETVTLLCSSFNDPVDEFNGKANQKKAMPQF